MVIHICQQKHNHHTQHNTQQHTQQHTQISNPPSRCRCLCCHIYNNSDNDDKVVSEAEEVSGINNNLSDDDSVDSCKDKEETEENQFFHETPDIQNWTTSRSVGMAFMEDHRFHSLFGVHIEIALIVWGMLWEGGLHPRKSKQSICFGCLQVGRSMVPLTQRPCENGCGSFLSALPSWRDVVSFLNLVIAHILSH